MLMFYTMPQNPIQFALIFGEWIGVVLIAVYVEKYTPWYVGILLTILMAGAWIILWDIFASLYVVSLSDLIFKGTL